MSLLILGATGTLGRQIVRKALNEGFQVKCFVRSIRKAAFLKEWGAELIYGDLKLPETIPPTLYGITAIIDAATARPSDLYNASKIDLDGKLTLIEAAKLARIKRFIFFSISNSYKYLDIPLMNLKFQVEQKLKNSNMNYTIFFLYGFFQGLITQYALPILDQQSIWITKESVPIRYIDTQDAAKFSIRSLSIPDACNQNFDLAGKQSWTSLEIINLCEKLSGKKSKMILIPIFILQFTRQLTKYFQWTWNISERLAFLELLNKKKVFSSKNLEKTYSILQVSNNEMLSLENYLQEYFASIMKKLKELNYEQLRKTQESNF